MDDILTNITDLFVGNGVIIVLGCFVIGTLLKGTFKKFPNKYIPHVNAIISIILGFIIPGTFDDMSVPAKIVCLAFIGLSSVGLYEILCTMVKERFSVDLKQIYNNILKAINDSGYDEEMTDNDESEDTNQELEDLPRDDINIDVD
jgi:hypothetical protein